MKWTISTSPRRTLLNLSLALVLVGVWMLLPPRAKPNPRTPLLQRPLTVLRWFSPTVMLQAAVALVQSNCDIIIFDATSKNIALPGGASAGNLIVVTIEVLQERVTPSSVVDEDAGALTSVLHRDNATTVNSIDIYRAVPATATQTYTITYGSAFGDAANVCAAEFSGNAAAGSIDDGTPATNDVAAATSHPTGTTTTTTADGVVIALSFGDTNTTWTPDATFTTLADGTSAFGTTAYRVTSSATGFQSTTTSGVNSNSINGIAAFKGAGGGGGGSNVRNCLLLGVCE